MKRTLILFFVLSWIPGLTTGGNFTVTNTFSSGEGSFRKAILDANTNPGFDTVRFLIPGPGAGPYVIRLAEELPVISGGIFIDGFTQPDSWPASLYGPAKIMIVIDGSNLSGSGLRIGSRQQPSPADASVVQGLSVVNFTGAGIECFSDHVKIRSNYIGLMPDGVVTGSNGMGILMTGSDHCSVGGDAPEDGNVISFNQISAILLQPNTADTISDLLIGFNIIGLDPPAVSSLGNGMHGISINGASAGLQEAIIRNNIIGSNGGCGIYFESDDPQRVRNIAIIRNLIGMNKNQMTRPNGQAGIYLSNVSHVQIGGSAVDANTITGSSGAGIAVTGNSSGVYISHNQIFGNSLPGIDLGNDGVSLNDAGDSDSGPNGLQNFPVIDSAILTGDTIFVYGKFNSLAGVMHQLGFYVNPEFMVQNATGYGEGLSCIGTMEVQGNGTGDIPFVFSATGICQFPDYITATGTNLNDMSTSEFSERVSIRQTEEQICHDTEDRFRAYTIPAVPGATSYSWSVPPGANVLSGQGTTEVLVDWSGASSGSQTICVSAVNSCGTSPAACKPVHLYRCITLSGHVFDDGNGLSGVPVNTVDGQATNVGGTLYINLVDIASNTVISSLPVASDGSFLFSAADGLMNGSAYLLILTQEWKAPGTLLNSASIPVNWDFTGENAGSGMGSDGAPDGILRVQLEMTRFDHANFGIDQFPDSKDTLATCNNPGGTAVVTVPVLSGSDPEDCPTTGSCSAGQSFLIRTIPGNASLYYDFDGSGPQSPQLLSPGMVIPSYDPSLLTADPWFNGAGTVVFLFSLVDSAGLADPSPAEVTMIFTPVADLLLRKTALPGGGTIGDTIVFRLTVRNNGPGPATNVVVYDSIRSGFSYISSVTGTGSYNPATGIWNVGPVTEQDSTILYITAIIQPSGPYFNTGIVSGSEPDPEPDNNWASVNLPVIVANQDAGASISSFTGGISVSDILANDRLDTLPASLDRVTIEFITSTDPGIYIEGTQVMVSAGTTPGDHFLIYRICDMDHPAICDTAIVFVPVNNLIPVTAADDDASDTPVNGMTGGVAVENILENDLFGNSVADTSMVTITAISDPADGVTLNTQNGQVTVAPGTLAGLYHITYMICTVIDPANCDTALITVAVAGCPELITHPQSTCSPGRIDLTHPEVTAGSQLFGAAMTYWKNPAMTIPVPNPISVGNGTYYIKATGMNGCTDAESVTVTIFPLPVVYHALGSGGFCQGEPGREVGLSGSQTGVMYSLWYQSLTPLGVFVEGTGDSLSFGVFSVPGFYFILAENMTTHCTNWMYNCAYIWEESPVPVSVTIQPSANPVANGTEVIFTAIGINGGNTPDYQWTVNGQNVGDNSYIFSYFPNDLDEVRCTMTSTAWCVYGNPAISEAIRMNVVGIPSALNISGVVAPGVSKCYAASQILTVAGNDLTFAVQSGGTATLVAGQRIEMLNGTSVHPGGRLHAWISVNGIYCGEKSTGSGQEVTGYEMNPARYPIANYRVWPNPTAGTVFIEKPDGGDLVRLKAEVFSMTGENTLVNTLSAEHRLTLDLSPLPDGFYFLRLDDGQRIINLKLVKIR